MEAAPKSSRKRLIKPSRRKTHHDQTGPGLLRTGHESRSRYDPNRSKFVPWEFHFVTWAKSLRLVDDETSAATFADLQLELAVQRYLDRGYI